MVFNFTLIITVYEDETIEGETNVTHDESREIAA